MVLHDGLSFVDFFRVAVFTSQGPSYARKWLKVLLFTYEISFHYYHYVLFDASLLITSLSNDLQVNWNLFVNFYPHGKLLKSNLGLVYLMR